MKKYTIAATCSGGTFIAGDYNAENEEEAITMAKEQNGDEWTYYVFDEIELNRIGRNFIVGYYKYGEQDPIRNCIQCYNYGNQVKYGVEDRAEEFLKFVKSEEPDKDWQIFWIDADRDNMESPEEIRERLKEEWEEEREEVEKWRPWG